MSGADGLELLKPFLPGLEAALEDVEISEITWPHVAIIYW